MKLFMRANSIFPHTAIHLCVLYGALSAAWAGNVREHTRLGNTGAQLTQSQAAELTLTLNAVERRPVQSWVRTAGAVDPATRVVTALLTPEQAKLVTVGQRVRAFSVNSKSSMYQAKVSRVVVQPNRAAVEATLTNAEPDASADYVLEIVVDRGEFLSVPNEAIIEEGDKQVVYVQDRNGEYAPRLITTGLQGERYTEVLSGLKEGEQIVTTGSFFVDAEYKMKSGN